MKSIITICGLAVIIGSGTLGMILDIKYQVRIPALYWFIGSLGAGIGALLLALATKF